jgi:hypothetical protein
MVKSGEISKKTGIGNLIEIHGDGGKGVHWTDGCVALENKEMDLVYSLSDRYEHTCNYSRFAFTTGRIFKIGYGKS